MCRCPVAVPYIFSGGQSRLENIDRCPSLPSLDSATGGGRVAPQTRTCGLSPLHQEKGYPDGVSLFLVPVTGLEPVRCRQRWILSPLRLPFHHTGRCVLIVAAFGGGMSPSFAVPGALLGIRLRRSPTAAPAPPSLYPPLAALGFAPVDFESTTSTIPSHRQVFLP